MGQLVEALGVSPLAATQLVARLVEHGMVERRHGTGDRRVVLVDYALEMRKVALELMEVRRRQQAEVFARLSDGEALVFVKGLRSLTEGFSVAPGEAGWEQ